MKCGVVLASLAVSLAISISVEAQQTQPNIHSQTIDNSVLSIPDRVTFGIGSAVVDGPAKLALRSQADWLLSNPDVRIGLEGHTDKRGVASDNQTLGLKRAIAVKQVLAELGIGPEHVDKVMSQR